MRQNKAVAAFAALGHDTRLAIFRLLVRAGPEGLFAGDIAAQLGVNPSNLTFHAAQLERATLVRSKREGRNIVYTADFSAMASLVDFLTNTCCGGHPEVCLALNRSKAAAP